MVPTDSRRTIGGLIEAKAIHVTSEAEQCSRRYGANKKTKIIPGVIVSITNVQNPENGRTTTSVTADFDLGGNSIKRATLNIRSIKVRSSNSVNNKLQSPSHCPPPSDVTTALVRTTTTATTTETAVNNHPNESIQTSTDNTLQSDTQAQPNLEEATGLGDVPIVTVHESEWFLMLPQQESRSTTMFHFEVGALVSRFLTDQVLSSKNLVGK
jgi:hypothetical protein